MQTIQSQHTIPPLLVPVYLRRIQNLRKVQKIVLLGCAINDRPIR